jgi:formylglycine-generating enzyme required for sulfatase activity
MMGFLNILRARLILSLTSDSHTGFRNGFSQAVIPVRINRAALGTAALTLLFVGMAATAADAQLERLRRFRSESGGAPVQDRPMVTVPAGVFWMGLDGAEALEDERPRHEVWLDEFSMDLHEVTTEAYARFLADTQRQPPAFWESVNLLQHGTRPVVGVTWEDAVAYCKWRGARLPTEAEWEKAARGTDERRYPWGNQTPTPAFANFALGARFSYDQVLLPVGHFPNGKSPYGLLDMAGNVWEWVSDWYLGNYYEASPARNPPGPDQGQFKGLRGGSWSDLPKYLLTYGRFKLPPNTRNSFTGFRCAKSAAP